VSQSRFVQILRAHRSSIALVTALGMIFGFLCGRAILSLSMFLFGLNAIWDVPPAQWLKQRWWILSLCWIGVYALSGFWSTDSAYLVDRLQVKLPFLLLPLAFGFLPVLSERQLRLFTFGMAILLFGGCLYTLSFAWRDPETVFNGYFTSKVMPTPAYKDHIRFSILIAWFILWCYYIFPSLTGRLQRGILVFVILFFTLFLHVLAVKSGLLFFYVFTISYIIYLFCSRRRIPALGVTGIFAALVLAAYTFIPSFHYKIGYVKYTFEEYQRSGMSGNFSDMGRIISYQAAMKIFQAHPLLGVGAGDILAEMKRNYRSFDPDIKEEQILIPHNQVLVVAIATGVAGLLPFLLWLGYPLIYARKNRDGYFIFSTWLCLVLSLFTEPMLEVQFGVFVFLFCMLWVMQRARVTARYRISAV
jgi:O-antigen ligase